MTNLTRIASCSKKLLAKQGSSFSKIKFSKKLLAEMYRRNIKYSKNNKLNKNCITIVLELSEKRRKISTFSKEYPGSCKTFLSDALSTGTKCVLVSVFTTIVTTCPNLWTKPLPMNAKSRLPVDERRLQMSLLKLPIVDNAPCCLVNHEARPWDHWRSQHW